MLTFLREITVVPIILILDCVFAFVLHKTTMVKAALLATAIVSGPAVYFLFRGAVKAAGEKRTRLREVLPSLLFIVIFFAARLFFTDLQPLKGSKFPMLPDLAVPNAAAAIIAGAATFGTVWLLTPLKGRAKILISAGMTLVCGGMLISAPSGMALYWLAAQGTALILWLILRNRQPKPGKKPISRNETYTFLGACALMTVLTGLFLPGKVILSSPLDFIDIRHYRSPQWYMLYSFGRAAGYFAVWAPICFFLCGTKHRRWLSCAAICIAVIAAVNGFFFGNGYGTMSSTLQFEQTVRNPLMTSLLNLAVCIAVAAAVVLIWKKDAFITQAAAIGLSLALLAMSGIDFFATRATISEMEANTNFEQAEAKAELPLDKTEKNVVVIMLDRAVGRLFPFMIEEKPELKEQFAGFTYYPNTMSYSHFTGWGAPPLYGGYEYTPENMDRRKDELLVDKYNEALKVMPVSFLKAGYDVTVCDPSYAGYSSIPDLRIYDDYPEIKTYLTKGSIESDIGDATGRVEELRERNFFCYSMMRAAPVMIHSVLYSNGQYNESNASFRSVTNQRLVGITQAQGIFSDFMKAYEVLNALPELTKIGDGHKGSYILLENDTAHDACLTQAPGYEPTLTVDNTEYEAEHAIRRDAEGNELKLDSEKQMTNYHSEMAALLKLGQWFDYLREEGVYENTKIIIVADHGWALNLFGLQFADKSMGWGNAGDILAYNPLLLVKDFGSSELKTDGKFMTNADTPTIAFESVIENPINPFTGVPIDSSAKEESTEQHIAATVYFNVEQQREKKQYPDETWIVMKNDIFDVNGWKFQD